MLPSLVPLLWQYTFAIAMVYQDDNFLQMKNDVNGILQIKICMYLFQLHFFVLDLGEYLIFFQIIMNNLPSLAEVLCVFHVRR